MEGAVCRSEGPARHPWASSRTASMDLGQREGVEGRVLRLRNGREGRRVHSPALRCASGHATCPRACAAQQAQECAPVLVDEQLLGPVDPHQLRNHVAAAGRAALAGAARRGRGVGVDCSGRTWNKAWRVVRGCKGWSKTDAPCCRCCRCSSANSAPGRAASRAPGVFGGRPAAVAPTCLRLPALCLAQRCHVSLCTLKVAVVSLGGGGGGM